MSRHIGITGSRNGSSARQVGPLLRVLTEFHKFAEGDAVLHHGKCRGIDEEAHIMARELGYLIVQHPPLNRAMESLDCDVLPGEVVWPRRAYLARDEDIVNAVETLVALPPGDEEDNPRSGTWATVRMARHASVPRIVIMPTGQVIVE